MIQQNRKGGLVGRPLKVRKIAEGLARLNFRPTFISTKIAIAVILEAQALRSLEAGNDRRH